MRPRHILVVFVLLALTSAPPVLAADDLTATPVDSFVEWIADVVDWIESSVDEFGPGIEPNGADAGSTDTQTTNPEDDEFGPWIEPHG